MREIITISTAIMHVEACLQVPLMRGEFLETTLYWTRVVSVSLGASAEKKVSQRSCVWGSVWVRQPVH